MEALGFTLTQLLRHSHRGGYHRNGAAVPGCPALEWGDDLSLSLVQVVDQPGFQLLEATPQDIYAYVELMNREGVEIDPHDSRFQLANDRRGPRVRAKQRSLEDYAGFGCSIDSVRGSGALRSSLYAE